MRQRIRQLSNRFAGMPLVNPVVKVLKNSAQKTVNRFVSSINGSKELSKELTKACHPDLFINSEKHQLAKELFEDISKNKRNLDKLIELKYEAQTRLGVQFKNR